MGYLRRVHGDLWSDKSAMAKADPNAIITIIVRVPGGEVPPVPALAPKVGPHKLSPKSVGEDLCKATKDWKGMKVKHISHDGNLSWEDVFAVARSMRCRSNAKSFKGTVLEVLGTARGLGCTIDGEDAEDATQMVQDDEQEIPEA